MPVLPVTELSSDRARLLEWLDLSRQNPIKGANWQDLAYQTVQTNGTKQAFSLNRGCLDYGWLNAIEHRTQHTLINHWMGMLGHTHMRLSFELDNLVDALSRSSSDAWMGHIRDLAIGFYNDPDTTVAWYDIHEVQEVTKVMDLTPNLSLSSILEREQGTYRFGCSLRLLGRFNSAVARDLIDALEMVRDRDQLFRVLAHAVQECAVATAKSPFIIVPNDEDFAYLLNDVDQHGAKTIAGLLIILSVLRYPRAEETDSTIPSSSIQQESFGGLDAIRPPTSGAVS